LNQLGFGESFTGNRKVSGKGLEEMPNGSSVLGLMAQQFYPKWSLGRVRFGQISVGHFLTADRFDQPKCRIDR
jgi:hypothetical protein